jgi:putative PIN family toxin of toxin-antitoxin system
VRIVLDTNVVLSALLWRGTPYRLLQTILQREHAQLFATAALLEELGEVLIRPVAAARLALIGRAAHEVLADYIDAVELVTPLATPPVVTADRDDDHVIAAAVAAEADLLVSGDGHLLALGSHRNIRIVTPADAARLIGSR